jgi:hypothetical protein
MHAVRCTMGADDHTVSVRRARRIEFATPHTQAFQMIINQGVVNELAEKSDRLTPGGVMGGTQGVANAEAHAVMLGEVEFHGDEWVG